MTVKLGNKYECFECNARFYDLGKPEAICPKCGANQKNDPAAGSEALARRKRRPDPIEEIEDVDDAIPDEEDVVEDEEIEEPEGIEEEEEEVVEADDLEEDELVPVEEATGEIDASELDTGDLDVDEEEVEEDDDEEI